MGGLAEYGDYDGLGLAELVRKGAVHPRELVEAAIARIEAANPKLNAVVTKLYDMVRSQADAPVSGPFAGTPFLLKDLNASLASAPMSQGNRRLKAIARTYDDELVKRYRNPGLIVVGKTNTPEFGLASVTEPKAFGPAHNPYDLARTPGGSSGGSGAAVAARLTPMSTPIPASAQRRPRPEDARRCRSRDRQTSGTWPRGIPFCRCASRSSASVNTKAER